MDREIKFRAWDSVKEKMLPVEAINWRENCISLDEEDNSISDTFELFNLMQFTGLNDKNGKEIYEGDIIRKTTLPTKRIKEIFKVLYDENLAMFIAVGKNFYTPLYIKFNNNFENIIIGNIYDNPELLEENKCK